MSTSVVRAPGPPRCRKDSPASDGVLWRWHTASSLNGGKFESLRRRGGEAHGFALHLSTVSGTRRGIGVLTLPTCPASCERLSIHAYREAALTPVEVLLDEIRSVSTSEKDKGDRFERLMLYAFQTDRSVAAQFEAIWLWDEWVTARRPT